MQKFIRIAIVVLLAIVTIAIIFSQTRLYREQHAVLPLDKALVQVVQGATSSAPPAAAGLSPADIARETAEHEKDRAILREIERDLNKLTASSLAQNYLLLFQAIIYFLTLIIIFSLLETVKKFAESASKSAESARILAESHGKRGDHSHSHPQRPEFNKFLVRRLRGKHRKQ